MRRIAVHIIPRASKTEIVGMHGDALKIRLAAPPVDGKANKALVAFLADHFNVPVRAIAIVSGATSRSKIIEVQ